MFTLEDLINYYNSFSNILFMQREEDNNSKDNLAKLKNSAVIFNKEYVIGRFKTYCK